MTKFSSNLYANFPTIGSGARPRTKPYGKADIISEKSMDDSPELAAFDPFEDEANDGDIEDSIQKEIKDEDISSVTFADEIKIDFIPSIDFRIMCRFLGLTSVNDVKNHPYQECPLITLMLMESLVSFMQKKGYSFEGELNFDRQGNSIPAEKTVWKIGGKEVSFTSTGFLYFKNKQNIRRKNLVFFVYTNLSNGISTITCYTEDEKKSETVIQELEKFTKENNCLRGAKLRDINMYAGDFTEAEHRKECTWDNYYYTEDVKEVFELEVFGFLKNVAQYNEYGITKRGIMIFGAPGTGKTTIGHIICNNIPDHTVIWITPESIQENHNSSYSSIKLLYKLADFVSPSVIILEDVDLFGSDRSRGGNLIDLGALMNVLDGVNTVTNAVTVATTNRLETIEGALRNRPGRFDRVVEIPALNRELRLKMFKNRLKSWKCSDDTIEHLVDKTDDWTGAESQEFVNTLNLKSIREEKPIEELTIKLVDEIIEVMSKFGIGENSGKVFGFAKNSKE